MYSIEAKARRGKLPAGEHLLLENRHLTGEKFSGRKLASFSSAGCTFERCSFAKLTAPHVVLACGKETSYYIDCIFDGTRFRHLSMGQARFERCSFLDVRIGNLFCHSTELVDCKFSGVMRGGAIYGRVVGIDAEFTTRRVNEIRGNDFSAMKLSDVSFRQGVDLSLQKLPVGDGYLHLPDAE
ncbi:MAG: hypothetical protein ABI821_00155 [Pseudomonadota bacterium]